MDFLFGIKLSLRKDGPWLAVAIAFILGLIALVGGDETTGYILVAVGLVLGILLLTKRKGRK